MKLSTDETEVTEEVVTEDDEPNWQTSVQESLDRLQELANSASQASTDAYKELLQREVSELKESISQNLEGTEHSLDSLGLTDFDVTGEFSIDTLTRASDILNGIPPSDTPTVEDVVVEETTEEEVVEEETETFDLGSDYLNSLVGDFSQFQISSVLKYDNTSSLLSLLYGDSSSTSNTFYNTWYS